MTEIKTKEAFQVEMYDDDMTEPPFEDPHFGWFFTEEAARAFLEVGLKDGWDFGRLTTHLIDARENTNPPTRKGFEDGEEEREGMHGYDILVDGYKSEDIRNK